MSAAGTRDTRAGRRVRRVVGETLGETLGGALRRMPWEELTGRLRRAGSRGRHAVRPGETPHVPMDARIALRRAEVEGAERRLRRSRLLSSLLGAMLAIVLVVGILAGPLFEVRDIEVVGADGAGVSGDEIRRLASVDEGASLLLVDVHAVEAGVASLPLVQSVQVSRRLPGTLSLRVAPRVAAAVTPIPEGVAIVDPDGIVLDVRPDASGLALPTVVGEKQHPLRPGDRWDDALARKTVVAITELPTQGLPRVAAASFDKGALVFTLEGGPRVIFGLPEDVARKGRVLVRILADLTARGQAVEYVDVSSADAPTIKPAVESREPGSD